MLDCSPVSLELGLGTQRERDVWTFLWVVWEPWFCLCFEKVVDQAYFYCPSSSPLTVVVYEMDCVQQENTEAWL